MNIKKKIIIPALMSALCLAGYNASAAAAENLSVKVSGHTEGRMVHSKNSATYGTSFMDDDGLYTRFNKHNSIDGDARLVFTAEGTTDGDVGSATFFNYGAEIVVNADKDSDSKDARIRNIALYTTTAAGKVILGGSKTASETLSLHAPVTATGGILGSSTDYMNNEVGYYKIGGTSPTSYGTEEMFVGQTIKSYFAAQYLTEAHMPSDASSSKRYSSKVSYYTPKLANGSLQFGVSFTPDTQSAGGYWGTTSKYASSVDADYVRGHARKVTSLAALYDCQMNNEVVVQASVAGEFGKAKEIASASGYNLHKNISAYSAGLNVGFNQFKVGGSYIHQGKSLNIAASTSTDTAVYYLHNKKSYVYTVGAAFEQGPVTIAANMLKSSKHSNRFRNIGLQAQYNLGGFTPYIEASSFKFNPNKTYIYSTASTSGTLITENNKGNVVFAGAVVNF